MTFLLDENFPKRAIPILEAAGHSCLDIRGTDDEGSDDATLFQLAQDHHAILLTTDKDFFHTVPMRIASHCGVIVIALRQPNGAAILAELDKALAYLERHPLDNRILLLTDRRSYLR